MAKIREHGSSTCVVAVDVVNFGRGTDVYARGDELQPKQGSGRAIDQVMNVNAASLAKSQYRKA